MLRLRVKELAEKQGLNRNQLQLKSGVTMPLLNRYWNNATGAVTLEALEKIAHALGVKAVDLIEELPDERKQEKMPETYREVSTEPDTFFVDEIADADVVPVIQEIGGTVEDAPDVRRMDGHVGRTRITLPAGCTYAGQAAGADNPQIITLPAGRQLMLSRRGAYEMVLQFRGGDSSDSSKWNGAVRIPDTDDQE